MNDDDDASSIQSCSTLAIDDDNLHPCCSEDTTVKAGWLLKQTTRKKITGHLAYNKRYFILDRTPLASTEDNEEDEIDKSNDHDSSQAVLSWYDGLRSSSPNGSVVLDADCVVRGVPAMDKPQSRKYHLELTVPGKRVYVLRANDSTVRDAWVAALSAMVQEEKDKIRAANTTDHGTSVSPPFSPVPVMTAAAVAAVEEATDHQQGISPITVNQPPLSPRRHSCPELQSPKTLSPPPREAALAVQTSPLFFPSTPDTATDAGPKEVPLGPIITASQEGDELKPKEALPLEPVITASQAAEEPRLEELLLQEPIMLSRASEEPKPKGSPSLEPTIASQTAEDVKPMEHLLSVPFAASQGSDDLKQKESLLLKHITTSQVAAGPKLKELLLSEPMIESPGGEEAKPKEPLFQEPIPASQVAAEPIGLQEQEPPKVENVSSRAIKAQVCSKAFAGPMYVTPMVVVSVLDAPKDLCGILTECR